MSSGQISAVLIVTELSAAASYMPVTSDRWPGNLLTAKDFIEWGRSTFGPRFIGVYARDELTKMRQDAEKNFKRGERLSFGVINTDVARGSGKHWLGATIQFRPGKPPRYFHFDSYAGDLLPEEKKIFTGYEVFRQANRFQGNPRREGGGIESASCGYWVARGLLDTASALT